MTIICALDFAFTYKRRAFHIPDKKAPWGLGAVDKWAQDITRLTPNWQAT